MDYLYGSLITLGVVGSVFGAIFWASGPVKIAARRRRSEGEMRELYGTEPKA